MLFLWRFAHATRLAAVFGLKKAPAVLPDDFDWKFYLDYYPDLRRAGLRTAQDAAEHYIWHGFLEQRFACAPEQDLVSRYEEVRQRQLKNIALFNDHHVEIIRNTIASAPVTVSVVITLYNYAQYIEACLRSVVNSTCKDFEIIVVNDASTDNSLELCRIFPACGIALTVLDKKINTGLVHSRNLGIQYARGEYVFILDADNEIYPDCLAEHVACMRADERLVACYGVIDLFDEDGRFFTQVSSDPFDYAKLLRGNYIDAMAMFDRRALIDIGMYNETLLEQGIGYEDYELWLRIGQQGHAVGFIERSLSRYLKKHDSMLAVADRYYRASLMRWIRQHYQTGGGPPGRTAVLVVGMHRSGTSALAGMLSLMGAYPGQDLIGPDRSNQKGHFEPGKIVAVNDALLASLGARGPDSEDLPADWFERDETRRAEEQLRRIIAEDYSSRDIFVIKDPRLCLVLPLYLKIFRQMDIGVRIIVIERDMREVLKSLHARDGMLYSRCRMYYEKHIRALERNLSGQSYCKLTFNQLVQEPGIVMEKIRAFIPRLAAGYSRDMDRQIEKFIVSAKG
jgi:GT2 family glycosyltransferase